MATSFASDFPHFFSALLLLSIFFVLPALLYAADSFVSLFATHKCSLVELNPIGVLPPNVAFALGFIVGVAGLLGLLFPRFWWLMLLWAAFVLTEAFILVHNSALLLGFCLNP